MAEANRDSLLDQVDEAYVACQICLNVFNDAEKKPKYLVCHHYFCLVCMQALVKEDSTIVCPLCRLKTKINGSVSQLTTNTIVLRMLEKMNPAGTSLNIDHSVVAPTAKLWCTVCAQDAKFCSSSGNHNLLNSATFCKEMITCFHKSRDDLKNRCSSIAQKIHANKTRLEGVLEALAKMQDVVQTELDSCTLGLETLEYVLLDGDQLAEPSSVDVQTCKTELSRTIVDLDKLKREAGVVGFMADDKLQAFKMVEEHHLVMELTRTGKENPAKIPQSLHNIPLFFQGAIGNHYPVLLQGFVPIVAFCIATLHSTSLSAGKPSKDGGKKLLKTGSSSHILSGTEATDKKPQNTSTASGKEKGKTLPPKKPSLDQNQASPLIVPASPRTVQASERTIPLSGQMTLGNTTSPTGTRARLNSARSSSSAQETTTGAAAPSPLNAPMEFSELLELLNQSQSHRQRHPGHENPVAEPVLSRQSSLTNAVHTAQQERNQVPGALTTQASTSAAPTPATASPTSTSADLSHYTSVDDPYYLVPNSLTLPVSPPPIPDRRNIQLGRPVPRPRQPAIRPELPPRPGRINEQ